MIQIMSYMVKADLKVTFMAGDCTQYRVGMCMDMSNSLKIHADTGCSLLFGLLLSGMDSTIVSTALVSIGTYFDDFVNVQWIVLAYLLSYLGKGISGQPLASSKLQLTRV